MTIQQKIKDLENQIEALKAQNLTNLNWNEAPIICELKFKAPPWSNYGG